MDFKLTYEGRLPSFLKDEKKQLQRSHTVHDIRQRFHLQLKNLWDAHPVLVMMKDGGSRVVTLGTEGRLTMKNLVIDVQDKEDFKWQPMVTEKNGLICKLDVLMLRPSHPGQVIFDIDNRLKTLFDALRKAQNPDELGEGTDRGRRRPEPGEEPFYVLLEDDSLITHLSVTTDTLLEPLEPVRGIPIPPSEQVRLVIGVTVRPYHADLTP